jgi:hypothetical protein
VKARWALTFRTIRDAGAHDGAHGVFGCAQISTGAHLADVCSEGASVFGISLGAAESKMQHPPRLICGEDRVRMRECEIVVPRGVSAERRVIETRCKVDGGTLKFER